MQKTAVATDKAPSAIGPYSQAIRADRFLFTSGQLLAEPVYEFHAWPIIWGTILVTGGAVTLSFVCALFVAHATAQDRGFPRRRVFHRLFHFGNRPAGTQQTRFQDVLHRRLGHQSDG